MSINGELYDQVLTTELGEGDLVFDTQDSTYGTVDMIHLDKKHVAVRCTFGAEVGVPISRLRKLVKT